jgi:hypothetical protein
VYPSDVFFGRRFFSCWADRSSSSWSLASTSGAERLGGPRDRTGRRRHHHGGRHDASNVRARLGLLHDACLVSFDLAVPRCCALYGCNGL